MRHVQASISICLSLFFVVTGPAAAATVQITGELRPWHTVTLTMDGPQSGEEAATNPFLDYRMTVTFQHASGTPEFVVQGYYAADGGAAETSATQGTKWRAHLTPGKTGEWTWHAVLVQGPRAAIDGGGRILAKETGTFMAAAPEKAEEGFWAKGRLEYTGGHCLRFAGNGELPQRRRALHYGRAFCVWAGSYHTFRG